MKTETPNIVKVKIKRIAGHEDIELPAYETKGSSGMDLRAAVKDSVIIKPGEIKFIPTGVAVSIPPGYEGQIRPRSGLALRHGIGMVNSPGTIDSDYRGEIHLVMVNWGQAPFEIKRGDRVAQMVISTVCRAELLEVSTLERTSRGTGGFGHSGVK
ncbi:MAG: dUTP diphosphatase [Deltaproteobacteria bacterium]|nr:dUTP diphosphatase [Deltaproteobacteria bacterium]MBW1920449.1 dUTP diphosphatase [Deltaproteobacteria bacterium]MBW1977042.1 dUTP diphosphatase [Deltaproteobacteria bacterium]MBW2045062.1 dUTP diphosphatase [Deltaproteobacteria bacterium]MBW2300564.1 dUTP diphosphatase [Deltaproteobacteria bacterium]